MLYKHFKLSEVDGAMLEWDELLGVELRGDNLQQFKKDWNTTCLNIRELPNERFCESLFRKQLEKSEQLKKKCRFTGKILPNAASRRITKSLGTS